MTLEEAKKKVIERFHIKKTNEIHDYGDFWVFCFPDGEEYDCAPPAIRKKDGAFFYFFYPNYHDKKYRVPLFIRGLIEIRLAIEWISEYITA